jgi:hypothetical protein
METQSGIVGKIYKEKATGKLFKVSKVESSNVVFHPWNGTKVLDIEMHTDIVNFESRMVLEK